VFGPSLCSDLSFSDPHRSPVLVLGLPLNTLLRHRPPVPLFFLFIYFHFHAFVLFRLKGEFLSPSCAFFETVASSARARLFIILPANDLRSSPPGSLLPQLPHPTRNASAVDDDFILRHPYPDRGSCVSHSPPPRCMEEVNLLLPRFDVFF